MVFKTHVVLFFNTDKWWFLFQSCLVTDHFYWGYKRVPGISHQSEWEKYIFLEEKMPYHSVRRHHHHHHIVRIGSGHTFTCRAGQTGQSETALKGQCQEIINPFRRKL